MNKKDVGQGEDGKQGPARQPTIRSRLPSLPCLRRLAAVPKTKASKLAFKGTAKARRSAWQGWLWAFRRPCVFAFVPAFRVHARVTVFASMSLCVWCRATDRMGPRLFHLRTMTVRRAFKARLAPRTSCVSAPSSSSCVRARPVSLFLPLCLCASGAGLGLGWVAGGAGQTGRGSVAGGSHGALPA